MRKLILLTFAVAVTALLSSPRAIATCTAMQNCANGSTVSCTGNSTCNVGATYVQCDGVTTSCPSSSCSETIECPPPYRPCTLFCSSSTGPCSQTSTSVTCGSTTTTCAGAPKNCPV